MANREQQQALRRCSLAAACLLLASLRGVGAFITVQGGTFVDENCKEFFFSGYNTWQLLETAAGYTGTSGDLDAQFKVAASYNLSTVRMFGFGVSSGFQLQYSPGSYNENAFKAFDKVLDTAAKYNLRLIIALMNNWPQDSNADNKQFYVGSGADPDSFFTSASAAQAYKNHLKVVVNRKNTINGKVYGSDPTIVSWNLINEPRCAALGCNANMQSWIAEMAPYLKSIDPNHLVTVGMDGFYDRLSCHAQSGNPSTWAGYTGQDFLPNHAVAGIDYAAIHLWPDNWKREDLDFGKIWLSNHSSDGSALGKPVVLEEFGKGVGGQDAQGQTDQERTDWYKLVYYLVENQLNSGSPLKGILFWRWDAVSSGSNSGSGSGDSLTLPTGSSVFQDIIKPFSQRVAGSGKAVSSCSPSQGTVAAASISSAGPGPDYFSAPDSSTCCSSDCGTMYGNLEGTVVSSPVVDSAGACCDSCKSTSGCNTWNYCYCDLGCAGGIAKGTCVLKSQGNAFYPRATVTGANGAGWIGGVPGQTSITPTWLCQPGAGASCPITEVATCPASELQASLQCPSSACNAKDQNVAGDTIVFDVNSNSPTKTVYSAADCCKACQQTSGCNTWTFCGQTEGCASDCPANVAIAQQTGAKTFGPYGGCQGNKFPYQQCTLKNSAGNKLTVYEQGQLQPWTSGTTFST